jgi:hypothetical protein
MVLAMVLLMLLLMLLLMVLLMVLLMIAILKMMAVLVMILQSFSRLNFLGLHCKKNNSLKGLGHEIDFSFVIVRHRPEQNRVTWETPSSVVFPLLQEPIGVLASYAPHAQMQV